MDVAQIGGRDCTMSTSSALLVLDVQFSFSVEHGYQIGMLSCQEVSNGMYNVALVHHDS